MNSPNDAAVIFRDRSSPVRLAENVRLVAGEREWAIYQLDHHNIIRISPNDGRRIKKGKLSDAAVEQLIDAGVYERADEAADLTREQVSVLDDRRDIPFRSAWLELTDACNLSCSHCYMSAGRGKSVEKIDWIAILRYLAEHGCQQAIFIGGEPLCHPRFLDYVEYAKRIAPKMRLCVVTNGTLWTESALERMKQLDVFLKFSLLGSTPARHDRVTGVAGSFVAVVQNLDLAIRLGIRLEVSTTLVPSSEESSESMSQFLAKRFGVVKHSTTRVRPQGRQAFCGNQTEPCTEDKIAVHISKRFYDLAHRCHPCLYGKAAFSHTGFVYPCVMARYEKIATELVLTRKPTDVFGNWWTLTKDKIDGCRDCALRYACFDCRGFARSLTDPPCNCRLAAKLSSRQDTESKIRRAATC